MQDINGAVLVTNSPVGASTWLHISDLANGTGRTATHSVNVVTGVATISNLASAAAISYHTFDVREVSIRLGSGTDTFTFANTADSPTTLDTGAGNDIVHVQRTVGLLTVDNFYGGGTDTVNIGNPTNGVQGILRAVTIGGVLSSTTLNINDTADTANRNATHSVNAATNVATISDLAPAPIHYRTYSVHAVNINLGSGHDTVNVLATATGVATTINGGPGVDHFVLGDETGTMDAVRGPLTLNGQDGNNFVTFYDWQSAAGHSYNFMGDTLIRDGMAPVRHSGMSQLILYTGTGDDGVDWQLSGPLPFLNWTDQAGNDTLVGPDAVNTWRLIDGVNDQLYADDNLVAFFSGVDNLIGGPSSDSFVFSDGVGISGFLWDVGGNALLDYSAWTTGVYVNLATYQATNILGGVYGIPYVIGGAGDDILVGDDYPNYLDGGPGRDLVIGGGASYSGYADYLVGGPGEDIVIGGFTAYDSDAGSLAAILAEWVQPTDYSTRFVNLYYGIGVPALNEGTVFYNYSYGNVLLGDADLDLFFGDPSYDYSDWDRSAEYFVQVY